MKRPFGTHFNQNLLAKTQNHLPSLPDRELFLAPFQDVMDEFYNDFFGGGLFSPKVHDKVKGKVTFPKADVSYAESDDGRVLCFDVALPGMKREDINVEYDPESSVLTISGEEKREEESGDQYVIKELKHSKFSRSWKIPKNQLDIEGRECRSSLTDGILTIAVPIKSEKPQKETKKKIIKIE